MSWMGKGVGRRVDCTGVAGVWGEPEVEWAKSCVRMAMLIGYNMGMYDAEKLEKKDECISYGEKHGELCDAGYYALIDAAMCGKWRNVEALLSAGCDVDCVDEHGWGALMHVVNEYGASVEDSDHSYRACLSLLLDAGCDIDAENHWDDTAESLAWKLGKHDIAGMIAAERERRALSANLSSGNESPRGGSLRV